jgi:hypothetical protein
MLLACSLLDKFPILVLGGLAHGMLRFEQLACSHLIQFKKQPEAVISGWMLSHGRQLVMQG